MTSGFRLLYSETVRTQIRQLHPQLNPLIKSKIEQIGQNPYNGKSLERDLSGYLSLRVKRYRVIYKIKEEGQSVEIHYVGHRKDIYELFGDQVRKLTA